MNIPLRYTNCNEWCRQMKELNLSCSSTCLIVTCLKKSSKLNEHKKKKKADTFTLNIVLSLSLSLSFHLSSLSPRCSLCTLSVCRYRAVVVAQLVEQSLQTTKVHRSNPTVGKFYIYLLPIVLKRQKLLKRGREWSNLLKVYRRMTSLR